METNSKQNKTANKKPEPDFDINHINKCTLCPYRTHVKSCFYRHLIKQHGIKLKGLEGFSENRETSGEGTSLIKRRRFPGQPRRCPKCNKLCQTGKNYKMHIEKCGTGVFHACPKCAMSFEKVSKLNKHLTMCGQEQNVNCELCEYRCKAMDRMIHHYITKHNLRCTPVEEPDFDQALNGTPYILERAIEVEKLPTTEDISVVDNATVFNDDGNAIPIRHVELSTTTATKRKQLFSCYICKKEFTKERFLNAHVKRGCD